MASISPYRHSFIRPASRLQRSTDILFLARCTLATTRLRFHPSNQVTVTTTKRHAATDKKKEYRPLAEQLRDVSNLKGPDWFNVPGQGGKPKNPNKKLNSCPKCGFISSMPPPPPSDFWSEPEKNPDPTEGEEENQSENWSPPLPKAIGPIDKWRVKRWHEHLISQMETTFKSCGFPITAEGTEKLRELSKTFTPNPRYIKIRGHLDMYLIMHWTKHFNTMQGLEWKKMMQSGESLLLHEASQWKWNILVHYRTLFYERFKLVELHSQEAWETEEWKAKGGIISIFLLHMDRLGYLDNTNVPKVLVPMENFEEKRFLEAAKKGTAGAFVAGALATWLCIWIAAGIDKRCNPEKWERTNEFVKNLERELDQKALEAKEN